MFEITPSFETMEKWEESLDSKHSDGKLKHPVTFHDKIPPIEEIPDQLTLKQPKKKETKVKVVDLGKKNKDKKGLF
jgi:hypothetical protein